MAQITYPDWEHVSDVEHGMTVLGVRYGDLVKLWYEIPRPKDGEDWLITVPSTIPDKTIVFDGRITLKGIVRRETLQRVHARILNGHRHPLDPSFDPDLRTEN